MKEEPLAPPEAPAARSEAPRRPWTLSKAKTGSWSSVTPEEDPVLVLSGPLVEPKVVFRHPKGFGAAPTSVTLVNLGTRTTANIQPPWGDPARPPASL